MLSHLLLQKTYGRSVVLGCILSAFLFLPTSTSAQTPVFDPTAYGLAAAYVMDPSTQKELYAWNENTVWPVASLTKLVSAFVWQGYDVPWKATMTLRAQDEVGGGRLRVPVGTKVSFEDLWYASITASANNAAMAIARGLGVSSKTFIGLMNKKALALKTTHTTFVDPSGMNPKNVSTAREMAIISRAAFRFRPLQKAASTASYGVRVLAPKPHTRPIKTTNLLLSEDPDVWVIAGKTGYLEESEHNFVGWMRPIGIDGKPENGKDVLVVVFGADTKEQMFASAKHLAQNVWTGFPPSRE